MEGVFPWLHIHLYTNKVCVMQQAWQVVCGPWGASRSWVAQQVVSGSWGASRSSVAQQVVSGLWGASRLWVAQQVAKLWGFSRLVVGYLADGEWVVGGKLVVRYLASDEWVWVVGDEWVVGCSAF